MNKLNKSYCLSSRASIAHKVNSVFFSIVILLSLISTLSSFAQNGQLPPVTFPNNSNVCDNRPWNLIFYDDFDGTKLNSPWITFFSWLNMNGGDNENWNEARCTTPYNVIFKKDNIIVSNGTVKLQVKKEPTFWKCDTCKIITRSTDYSGATIQLPFTHAFNSGKFEARLKLPTFNLAHSTFWLYGGTGVTEIDMPESYGQDGYNLFGGQPKCDYSIHAWPPDNKLPNPYNMTHIERQNRYPNQRWWDWVRGRYFNQSDWHTYTTEWDSSVIRFYLDGGLVNTFWKYYKLVPSLFGNFKIILGSGCNATGTYKGLPGFPYDNQSHSNLRITSATKATSSFPFPGNGQLLGEMEIDYVKIWQKQIDPPWKQICDNSSIISGPSTVCSTATYTINPPVPNGTWQSVYPNLTVLSSNNNSVVVQRNPNDPNTTAVLNYLNPAACPGEQTNKQIQVGVPTNSHIVCSETHNSSNLNMHYKLNAFLTNNGIFQPLFSYLTPTTFEWNIDYGPYFSLHYHSFGQSIATPTINYTPGVASQIKWQVKITNDCGTEIKTGIMNYNLMRKVQSAETDIDPNNVYVVADIPDYDAYQIAVQNRLYNTQIDEASDDITINSFITNIEMEELEPYLILDENDINQINTSRKTLGSNLDANSETQLFPNPTKNYINIIPTRCAFRLIQF